MATVRDAEIEHVIRRISLPIFRSAGLPHENVSIYLLNKPRINAFVAGGANIFIHSGLIEAADTPEMFLGVIAHEVGHIDGAHLVRLSRQTDTVLIGNRLQFFFKRRTITADLIKSPGYHDGMPNTFAAAFPHNPGHDAGRQYHNRQIGNLRQVLDA